MKNEIQSVDTIFHITQVIKDMRNKKIKNVEQLSYTNSTATLDDFYAIIDISKDKNYFVQIITEDATTMHAEVASTQKDVFKLSTDKRKRLESLGWLKPMEKMYPNYWKTFNVASETECYETAAELVLAMIIAFDYRTHQPVTIKLDEYNNKYIPPEKNSIKKVRKITRNVLLAIAALLKDRKEKDITLPDNF